jgi:hypothetical protein
VTISKKVKNENQERLNKSDISKRPVSPFGTIPG